MFFRKAKCLTPEQAKEKVFEYWNDLDALSKRRFPGNENLAHQALLDSLDYLEVNEWRRVCAWEGKGPFLTFLITLVSRLLTDYSRKRFGYIRPPKWLQEKSDDLWNEAYKLLVIKQYERQETIEMLYNSGKNQNLSEIEEAVITIQGKCLLRSRQQHENTISLDSCADPRSTENEPLRELTLNSAELIEILLHYLQTTENCQLPSYIQDGVLRLKSLIKLDEKDRLLMHLRYAEGMSLKAIVKILNFQGDPYKRLNKLTRELNQACQEAGLIVAEIDLDD